jgi:hypothetical protein
MFLNDNNFGIIFGQIVLQRNGKYLLQGPGQIVPRRLKPLVPGITKDRTDGFSRC